MYNTLLLRSGLWEVPLCSWWTSYMFIIYRFSIRFESHNFWELTVSDMPQYTLISSRRWRRKKSTFSNCLLTSNVYDFFGRRCCHGFRRNPNNIFLLHINRRIFFQLDNNLRANAWKQRLQSNCTLSLQSAIYFCCFSSIASITRQWTAVCFPLRRYCVVSQKHPRKYRLVLVVVFAITLKNFNFCFSWELIILDSGQLFNIMLLRVTFLKAILDIRGNLRCQTRKQMNRRCAQSGDVESMESTLKRLDIGFLCYRVEWKFFLDSIS